VSNIITSPSLQDIYSIRWSNSTLKRVSKLFFAVQVIFSYKEHNKTIDETALIELKNKLTEANGVPHTFIEDAFLKQIAQNFRSELSPVCAILGGLIGQEVIKFASGKDEPIKNVFCYSGLSGPGIVEFINPN